MDVFLFKHFFCFTYVLLRRVEMTMHISQFKMKISIVTAKEWRKGCHNRTASVYKTVGKK